MIYKTFQILLLFSLFLSSGFVSNKLAFSENRNIDIKSIDEHGLDLEISSPPFKLVDMNKNGKSYTKVQLDSWAKSSRTGFPELPFTGVLLQVPLSGNINVEILKSSYKTIPNIQILPVSKRTVSDTGEVGVSFVESDIYGNSGFYPESLVMIDSRGILHDESVARLLINPFQWNPATNELRYYTELSLRVNFGNPLPPENRKGFGNKNIFDKIAKKSIINYRSRERIQRDRFVKLAESTGPDKESLRIEVKKEGIYRITYDELVNAGLNLRSIDASSFQLFNNVDEVAVKVLLKRKRINKLTPGSFIEFFARGVDTLFTDSNIYWLQWGESAGKRVSQINGEVVGGIDVVNSFFEQLHFEENHFIWQLTPGAEEQDYWFWEKFTSPMTSEFSVDIPSPDLNQSEVNVRVAFQGRSTSSIISPNHHTEISVNGADVSESFWDNDTDFIQEFDLASELLSDGQNSLTVNSPGDTDSEVDIVYVNWIELDYLRLLEVVQDALVFSVEDEKKVEINVTGFSNKDVIIYNTTDPLETKEIVNFSIEADGAGNKVSFDSQVSGKNKYIALTVDQIMKPESVSLWQPADLKNSENGADYIFVTAKEFIPELKPLIELHQGQGLRVKAVSVEDIYNEFNFGQFDPTAIKDFLKFAFENWGEPAPTYVMFVGDANTDYRDYLETGKENIVPVKHSFTSELGVTPDDTWYVSVSGDDILPDMLLGRIPGNKPKKVAEVINKIVDYEEQTSFVPDSVLIIADEDQSGIFERLSDELAELVPDEFNKDRIKFREFEDKEDATNEIISKIDEGQLITNYLGHGAVKNWSVKDTFVSENVGSLSNGNGLTFVITLNCLNGFFGQPFHYSLGEEFVIAKDKGAIAAFSSSTLGFTWEHDILNENVFNSIFENGNDELGFITTQSKIDAFAEGITEDTMISFTLFGDPAGKLKIGE